MRRPHTREHRWRRRGIAVALAAVLTAAAVVVAGSVLPVQAFYSDQLRTSSSAQAGETGVRVTTTVTPAGGWPQDAGDLTDAIVDEITARLLGDVPTALQSTAEPLIETAVRARVGPLLATKKAYTATVTVQNTGTLTESTKVRLFDYFDDEGETSTPEQGSVLISTSTDPIALALGEIAQDLTISVSVPGLSLGLVSLPGLNLSIDLSDLFPEPPGTVIGAGTPDDSAIVTDGTFEGQAVDLAPITLDPLESQTSTYTVLVDADDLVDLGIVTSDDPELNLDVGATADATGVNAGVRTGWTAEHTDWDGTLVHVDINNPPVVVATTSQDQSPFVGQIGDTANGQPTVDAYLHGLFRATDVEDPNSTLEQNLDITTDLDPTTPGDYTATATVTDSGGLSADPVTQRITVWNFVDVAGGQYHTLALDSRGRAWGWGEGAYGKVDGSGGTGNVSVPQLIKGLPAGVRVVGIAASFENSFFAMADGSVYAIGYNADGQLGNGTTTNSATPVKVSLPVAAAKVSALRYSAAVLGTDGSVWTWGYNDYGTLGTGDSTRRAAPVEIIPSGAVDVGQGAYGGAAVMADGTIAQWGTNWEGEMGTGATDLNPHEPTPVPGVTNATRVEVGQYHTLYVTAGGSVRGYGSNRDHRFSATLPASDAQVPTLLSGAWDGDARQAHAGWDYSQIVTDGGDLYAIGYNSYDSLFIGNTGSQTSWVESSVLPAVSKVTGFYDDSTALKSDGSMILTKGYGAPGTLGNGSTSDLNGTTVGRISLTNVYADGKAPDPSVTATTLSVRPGAVPDWAAAGTTPTETPTPAPAPMPSPTPSPSGAAGQATEPGTEQGTDQAPATETGEASEGESDEAPVDETPVDETPVGEADETDDPAPERTPGDTADENEEQDVGQEEEGTSETPADETTEAPAAVE